MSWKEKIIIIIIKKIGKKIKTGNQIKKLKKINYKKKKNKNRISNKKKKKINY